MPDPESSNGDKSGPPVQPVPVTPRGTLPVLRSDQLNGLRVIPWHLVEVQDDEHQLVISINASPLVSSSLKGVSITESPTEVAIVVHGTPPPEGPVTAIRVDVVTTVRLADPLGSRRLIGADDRP
jgi:hypothetical protein